MLLRRPRLIVLAGLSLVALGACTSPLPAPGDDAPSIDNPWVRNAPSAADHAVSVLPLHGYQHDPESVQILCVDAKAFLYVVGERAGASSADSVAIERFEELDPSCDAAEPADALPSSSAP